MSSKSKLCFFDISIDKQKPFRLSFELFERDLPKTTKNFRKLCTGEAGRSNISGIFFTQLKKYKLLIIIKRFLKKKIAIKKIKKIFNFLN